MCRIKCNSHGAQWGSMILTVRLWSWRLFWEMFFLFLVWCEINGLTYPTIVFWQLDHFLITAADTKSQEAPHLLQSHTHIPDQTNGASTVKPTLLFCTLDVLYFIWWVTVCLQAGQQSLTSCLWGLSFKHNLYRSAAKIFRFKMWFLTCWDVWSVWISF